MNFSEIMAEWAFALFTIAILSYLWKLTTSIRSIIRDGICSIP